MELVITDSNKPQYEFTTDWFSGSEMLWKGMIDTMMPSKILEIGSFEGRSTCYLIKTASEYRPLDIYCVDTWQGSVEHEGIDFNAVERRFDRNVQLALQDVKNQVNVYKLRGKSVMEMSKLLVAGEGNFDLIYIDGSHEAADVFVDAALAFQLLKVDGLLLFDDYHISEEPKTIYNHPHIAIDAFMHVYADKMSVIKFKLPDGRELDDLLKEKNQALYQFYARKIAA